MRGGRRSGRRTSCRERFGVDVAGLMLFPNENVSMSREIDASDEEVPSVLQPVNVQPRQWSGQAVER